jgi:hypothetical protein
MLSAKPRVRLSTGFIFQQIPCESVIPSEVAGQTAAEVVEKTSHAAPAAAKRFALPGS